MIYNEENKEAGIYALVWALLIKIWHWAATVDEESHKMIDCPLALFGISLQGREMSWNLLASEHQSEISIDIKHVAKATICTPHNNGEIRGI